MPELATPPTAPPTTPAPVPEAHVAPPAATSQSFDAAFPDDGLDTPPEPAPKPAPEPAKAKTEGKSPEAKTTTPAKEGKTEEAPAEPESKPEHEFTPPQVAKPNELKKWAQRMGLKAQKAEAQVQQLTTRIAQLEAQPPKQLEDTANLAQELAAAKKQIGQYENELRLTKYERSGEYREKYQAPYQQAVNRAYREVKELIAFEPNPEDPENPRERTATPADFDEIYQLPLGQASRVAKAKFGDAANIVLNHRQTIRQLAEAAYAAVEEYKGKGTEYETQTKAQQAQMEAAKIKMFEMAREGHAKRSAELFLPRDGDNEGNELLQKGQAFASAVFGGDEGLTPQQVVFRDSMAFNRLASYPRLVRDVKALRSQLAEAEKTIEGLRASGPGPAKATGEKKTDSSAGDWRTDFDSRVPA